MTTKSIATTGENRHQIYTDVGSSEGSADWKADVC